MIIFDLDGTLADCEHRRHFVERCHPINENKRLSGISLDESPPIDPNYRGWRPDWKLFYEACDQDKPIEPVIDMLNYIKFKDQSSDLKEPLSNHEVQIWSGRCESVRKKTKKWLSDLGIRYDIIKMRPIGDSTPDDVLKEKWLDEALAQGKTIDFVFDDRPKVVRMWRRRGIFVFNCAQHDGEF